MYVQGLIERANKGSVDAQYELAKLYLSGDGIEKDINLAVKWLNFAAKNGHEKANFELGKFYYNANDNEKAKPFFEFAANAGIVEALYFLGNIYAHSFSEYDKAIHYYYLAANKGHCESQYTLGCIIIQIRYVDVNDNTIKGLRKKIPNGEEYKWIEAAADQGHIDAIHDIGREYLLRTLPPYPEEKVQKALKLLIIESNKGSARAKLILGTYFEFVAGGSEGRKLAEKLYRQITKQQKPRPSNDCYNSAMEGLERVLPGYKKIFFTKTVKF